MKIIFATHNKNKLKELGEILNGDFELMTLSDVGFSDEIDETGDTIDENALIKARTVACFCREKGMSGYAVLADDTGLFTDALNGEPGVYSARYSGDGATYESNNEKLLSKLENVNGRDRSASFRTAVACVLSGGEEFVSLGECSGTILREKRGANGFGYDPIFFCDELGKTFAEAEPQEKNRVSHRGKALRAAAALLKEKMK